jgi:23S rRNA (uracil1939-C5)-methyltransferase
MNQALCLHFGECGGCSFQDVAYEAQLTNKEKTIRDLAAQTGFACPIRPINHFSPWYYRNKMEFTFGESRGELVLGMNSKNQRNTIFNMSECRIFSKDTSVIIDTVREFCRSKGYKAYNKYTFQGFLRYLTARETKFTKQLMLGIVTTNQTHLDKTGLVEALQKMSLDSKLTSVWHISSDSVSDAVVFDKKELLWGEEFVQETLGDFKFNIGIDSFFQVNPPGQLALYEKIREYVSLTGNEKVLDLFCGVGSIGIFLAAKAKQVWGVELIEPIIEAARANAKLNDIRNIDFFTADARKFLNIQGEPYRGIDLAIVNPPRSGAQAKFIRALLRIEPKMIVYSSCNPNTQFEDLALLKEAYEPLFFEPFDFFPHTRHLECLTILRRK